MMGPLVLKLLRDLRIALLIVLLLLAAFQCLWAKITERITAQLSPLLVWLAMGRNVTAQQVEETIFEGPGRITRTLMGGGDISFLRVMDMLSVSYVHPLVQTLLCVWAVGRASSAITGEIDRGTMELLLSQPLARTRIVLAHLLVDVLTIPLLCLSMWFGNWLGMELVGVRALSGPLDTPGNSLSVLTYAPALFNVGALVFAMTGYTMWLSSMGRFRGRVMGIAVLLTLLQFLINVVGQMWDALAPLRPLTIFYYYQPQLIMLSDDWTANVGLGWNTPQNMSVNVIAVLMMVGLAGYGLALWHFNRRDIPAPL